MKNLRNGSRIYEGSNNNLKLRDNERFHNGSKLIYIKRDHLRTKTKYKSSENENEGSQLLRTQTKNFSKYNPIATNNTHTNQELQTHILQAESDNRQEPQEGKHKRKMRVSQQSFMRSLVW